MGTTAKGETITSIIQNPQSNRPSSERKTNRNTDRRHASDVHSRLRGQAPLHPQEGRPRPGHQVGAPRALLARRQVVAPARDSQEEIRTPVDAAEGGATIEYQ